MLAIVIRLPYIRYMINKTKEQPMNEHAIAYYKRRLTIQRQMIRIFPDDRKQVVRMNEFNRKVYHLVKGQDRW